MQRMSRVDTAWLRMDTPANLMMIVGVWLLEPRLTRADVAERARSALLPYRRFGQKVVVDAVGASWVDDADFDIDRHVVAETLAPADTPLHALQARVAELAATPLNPAHPLWQLSVIEDYDGQHSALVSRIHHCIADGIALISVMLSITDGGKPPPARARQERDEDDEGDWLTRSVLEPLTRLTTKAIDLSGSGFAKGLGMLANPSPSLLQTLGAGAQVLSDVAALALMPDDAPTRLKGTATPGKRVAWGEPLPLNEVKAVGQAWGCSINDVLLACVAGAIGDYLRAHGDDPSGQEIRAMVPVNLRPLDQAWKLGNRFGLVPLTLPIGMLNPIERLYAVRARMNALKGSYQPLLAFGVLAVSGMMLAPVQAAVLNLFSRKATAVMTNVPGPKDPLKFCGSTVRQVMFWVPQSGDIGMGVSILSYGGGVQFGLITDARLCPDPQAIVERFAPEFDQLLYAALLTQ